MEFKDIQEQTTYYLKRALVDTGTEIYESLNNIQYVEDKITYAQILAKKDIEWVSEKVPNLENFAKVNSRNFFNAYSVRKVITAKLITKEQLKKIADENKVLEMSEVDTFNIAISKVANLQEREISREYIHVYKTEDRNLIQDINETMMKGTDTLHGKLIIMAYLPKGINENVSEEHNKIYTRAKKLGLPKALNGAYGSMSTYDFFKKYLNTFENTAYLSREDSNNARNSYYIIKEKRLNSSEKPMFDRPKERILTDIRNKNYDKLVNTLKIYYKGKDGGWVEDTSKTRLLCWLYMLEDNKLV